MFHPRHKGSFHDLLQNNSRLLKLPGGFCDPIHRSYDLCPNERFQRLLEGVIIQCEHISLTLHNVNSLISKRSLSAITAAIAFMCLIIFPNKSTYKSYLFKVYNIIFAIRSLGHFQGINIIKKSASKTIKYFVSDKLIHQNW